jgi:hypothetical protein
MQESFAPAYYIEFNLSFAALDIVRSRGIRALNAAAGVVAKTSCRQFEYFTSCLHSNGKAGHPIKAGDNQEDSPRF